MIHIFLMLFEKNLAR